MITAFEARANADIFHAQKVFNRIESYANNGKYEVTILYYDFRNWKPDSTVLILLKNGFKIALDVRDDYRNDWIDDKFEPIHNIKSLEEYHNAVDAMMDFAERIDNDMVISEYAQITISW